MQVRPPTFEMFVIVIYYYQNLVQHTVFIFIIILFFLKNFLLD